MTLLSTKESPCRRCRRWKVQTEKCPVVSSCPKLFAWQELASRTLYERLRVSDDPFRDEHHIW